jgi:hypothetical protein
VVGAELELALGQDHPVGDGAAELGALEPPAVGQHGAGQGDGDRRAGTEVPGAAHDLTRLLLAHVDAAELQAVGVRMLAGFEHAPDAVEAEVPVLVRDAAVDDALDLGDRDVHALRELLDRNVHGHVIAQPGERDTH